MIFVIEYSEYLIQNDNTFYHEKHLKIFFVEVYVPILIFYITNMHIFDLLMILKYNSK